MELTTDEKFLVEMSPIFDVWYLHEDPAALLLTLKSTYLQLYSVAQVVSIVKIHQLITTRAIFIIYHGSSELQLAY
eukprot:scaffold1559_cov193-Alexandrium_tamarense.AAC.15